MQNTVRATTARFTAADAATLSTNVPTFRFVCSLLDVFAGPNHGLRVAVRGAGLPGEQIEVIGGWLPEQLRAGLPRAHAYWEKPRCGSIGWDEAPVVWHTSHDGRWPRFAIRSIGALIDLVAERRAWLEGASA